MNKTKIVAAGLSIVALMSMVTACSPTSKWHEEAKAAVPEKFDEKNRGKFWLNGDTYEFPCALEEFTKNGWELEKTNAPKTIEPHEQTELAYYFKKGEDEILLGLTNTTEDKIDLMDAYVDYIEMPVRAGKAVVAGDIELFYQKYDKAEDFLDFTGYKDDFTEQDPKEGDGIEYVAEFEDKNSEYGCYVGFVVENSQEAYRVTKITYSWDYTFEVSFVDEIDSLITGVLRNDDSYIKDYVEYYSETFCTEERAYLPQMIINDTCGFNVELDTINPDSFAALNGFIDFVLKKADYSLEFAKDSDDVVMTFTAPDLITVAKNAFDACDEVYEGTPEEAQEDPAYVEMFIQAMWDQSESIEILPERDVVISYSTEYYYDIPFVALLGFADAYGL